MKIKILTIFIVNLLFLGAWLKPVFALEHTQKDGLFKMDIPKEWHWVDNSQEVVITFPDGKTMAIDIELVPSSKLSQTDIKKALEDSDDKMIKEGIEAHQATLIDNKEIKFDGVYAKQLDFKTAPPDPIFVTYISLFNKGYAFTITYGSGDDKMRSMMDDAVATFKFN
jgi:hypothetical protein